MLVVLLLQQIKRLFIEDDGGDGRRRSCAGSLDLDHDLIVERRAGGFGKCSHGRRVGGDAHQETLECQEHVLGRALLLLVLVLLLLLLLLLRRNVLA